MANVTEITIQAPSDDCILWEYDLTGVKKLKIQETGTRRGVLCECDPRGNITEVRARDVKLDKNKKYRLFGLRNDFAKVFADENEFRVVTGPRVFDWDGLRFQAKLIIIGTLDMSVQNQIQVVKQFREEVTPESPVTRRTIRQEFFWKSIGPAVEEAVFKGCDGALKYPFTDKPNKASGQFYDSVKVDWHVTGFEVKGEEFDAACADKKDETETQREIDKNRRTARVIDSEADILESTRRATRIAKDVQDIKDGN